MTIKEYREAHGMTQGELAETVGVAQNVVSRWERGTVQPSMKYLPILARIFGCRVEDIRPAPRKRTKTEILTAADRDGLTAAERQRKVKMEWAKELSGLQADPETADRLAAMIPANWWADYSAQHIGEALALMAASYQAGHSA